MQVRVFRFRVPKKNERKMRAFMRGKPLRLLRRVPGCRAAYFLRGTRKQEYLWITVWTSDAARRRAMARKDWKALVREEERGGFFAGRHEASHYQVLLKR